jgi:4-hydroxybenzoyl-CoA thioesterase
VTGSGSRAPVRKAADLAQIFSTQRKIRFSHCDPAGIVYFVHFFDMINGCVEDWLTDAIGLSSHELMLRRRVGFPIVNTSCEFFRPCHLTDVLALDLTIARIGKSSIEFVIRGRVGNEAKWQARHKVAMVSLDAQTSMPIPDELRRLMEPYCRD